LEDEGKKKATKITLDIRTFQKSKKLPLQGTRKATNWKNKGKIKVYFIFFSTA